MTRIRTAVAAMTILALTGSAFAADTVALAPGKPAGVHQATRGNGLIAIGVAVLVAGAVGIAIASSNSANPPASSAVAVATTSP